MFDRYSQSPGDRSGDEVFRKMLFGGNGRRNAARPAVIPVMEQVSPQSVRPAPNGNAENAEIPCLPACSLAMVYSPPQEWRALYPVGEAIRRGTLFSELDKPFAGKTLSGR